MWAQPITGDSSCLLRVFFFVRINEANPMRCIFHDTMTKTKISLHLSFHFIHVDVDSVV